MVEIIPLQQLVRREIKLGELKNRNSDGWELFGQKSNKRWLGSNPAPDEFRRMALPLC